MARARNIKPSITTNEKLADLKPFARILFIYLPMFADCEGKLEDRPRRIKAQMFPFDSVDVDNLLTTLDEAGFITRYSVSNSNYILIDKFLKHQNPHKNERDIGSKIPYPDKDGTKTEVVPAHDETDPADSLNLSPDSLNTDSSGKASVAVVWDFFLETFPDKKISLTPKRREKIKTALKNNPVEFLKTAITNFSKDNWKDRYKFSDIIHCFKNQETIERWINFTTEKPKTQAQLDIETEYDKLFEGKK